MAEVTATARIDRPMAEVFAYLAEFSNTEEWDPGVSSARRLDTGEVGVGSRFEVTLAIGPLSPKVVYEITSHQPDHRVILETSSAWHRGRDEVNLTADGDDACTLDWVAAFAIRGPGRLLDPALTVGFKKAARDAMGGLVATLGGAVVRV